MNCRIVDLSKMNRRVIRLALGSNARLKQVEVAENLGVVGRRWDGPIRKAGRIVRHAEMGVRPARYLRSTSDRWGRPNGVDHQGAILSKNSSRRPCEL